MLIWIMAAQAAPTWGPCPDGELDDLGTTCAELPVPLDHEDPSSDTVDIALMRVPSPEPPRGQLWFVTGGPGDSGIADLSALRGFQDALAPDLELLTLDVRGVGRSARLGCPAQEAPDSDEGRALTPDEWRSCAATLPEATVAPFTTTQTARDLIAAVEASRGDGEVFLWGVSYGTFLVDRVLALAPDLVDGVILDGIVPPDWSFLEFDDSLDVDARRWADRCADDPTCTEVLGPDPAAFAESLLADIAAGHCSRLGLDAPTSRLLAGVFLMGGGEFAGQIPAVWHRLSRCGGRDVRAFVHLFDTLFPEGGDQEAPSHAPVLQRQIAYTDLWGPAPPLRELQARVDHAIATTEVTLQFAVTADAWPVTDPGPWHQAPPQTDVPVLALHGGFDPTVSVERAADRAAWLTGPSQHFVAVPESFHVTFNEGACPQSIYADFLADPQAPVDTSCVEEMARLGVAADSDLDTQIWGVDDRWDVGGCTTSGGTGAWWAGLWALCLTRRRRPVRTGG